MSTGNTSFHLHSPSMNGSRNHDALITIYLQRKNTLRDHIFILLIKIPPGWSKGAECLHGKRYTRNSEWGKMKITKEVKMMVLCRFNLLRCGLSSMRMDILAKYTKFVQCLRASLCMEVAVLCGVVLRMWEPQQVPTSDFWIFSPPVQRCVLVNVAMCVSSISWYYYLLLFIVQHFCYNLI